MQLVLCQAYPLQQLDLSNNTTQPIKVTWVDSLCLEYTYKTLTPGESYSQNTYINQVWRFRDATTNAFISEKAITETPLTANIAPDLSISLSTLKGVSPPSVPGLLSSDSSRTDIPTPGLLIKQQQLL